MTTPDYRALCAELADHLQARVSKEDQEIPVKGYYSQTQQLVDRARAALAEPEPPVDGQMAAAVAAMAELAFDVSPYAADFDTRAADLLSHLAPQPVPKGPTTDELHQVFHDYARDFCKEKVLSPARFCVAARAVLARWGR